MCDDFKDENEGIKDPGRRGRRRPQEPVTDLLYLLFFRKRALKRSSLSQIKAEMEIVYNVQGKADEGKIKSNESLN